MQQRGSLIIYDNEGTIWFNTGDAIGDGLLSHIPPVGIPYIITEYGYLDGKILKSVNPETKELVFEEIPKMETEEEKLKRELLEAQEQIVNLEYEKLTGGI